MKYEFRLRIECEPEEAEQIKDWLYSLNDEDEKELPVIEDVTYDVVEKN